MAKRQAPYPLRIPDELRYWLNKTAKDNHRSVNSELNVLIESAKERARIKKSEKI